MKKEYKLKCCLCSVNYKVCKSTYHGALRDERIFNYKHFCSLQCRLKSRGRSPSQTIECLNCNKKFKKLFSEIKKTPRSFCSRSCSATFNNKNKAYGTRRSKLENYIEEKLKESYPKLEIIYNKKNTINSELDIYIPFLRLAFELNGILHYKPIYGEEKLKQIQSNDAKKFRSCIEKEIKLYSIDCSKLSKFNLNNAKKYLNIVSELIDSELFARRDLNPPRLSHSE